MYGDCFNLVTLLTQGWVFAAAKSIFARTVEKNRQKLAISLVH